MTIQGGALAWEVTLLRAVRAKASMGTPKPVWTPFEDGVRAKWTDVSDAERDAGDQTQASITARFLIRWSAARDAIVPGDFQLLCDGARFAIVAVKQPVRRREIELSVKALQGVAAPGGNDA